MTKQVEILKGRVHSSWEEIFLNSTGTRFLHAVSSLVRTYTKKDVRGFNINPINQTVIVPRMQDILHPFRKTNFNEIKVVILNDNPMDSIHASGIPFLLDHKDEVKNPNRCLEEAYQIHHSDPFIDLNRDDFDSWMSQGVLLINASLTREYRTSTSHRTVWSMFNESLLNDIYTENPDCVFVALGGYPYRCLDVLPPEASILAFPNADYSTGESRSRFNNSGLFKQINQELEDKELPIINW
jgi:uracil DNA glycosylase